MNTQQEAECDKPIRNGMMHDDMSKDKGNERGSGSGRERMESRRDSMMEGGRAGRGCTVGYWMRTTEGERERKKKGGPERKAAGEAMRRKSTAHQGEIEMMERSQLRHRDRRREAQ